MLKKGFLVICVLLIASCKSYDLVGKEYRASNQEKVVAIEFINDTLCKVNQKFLCDKLPEKYKSVGFNATYKVSRMNIKTHDANFKPTRFKADILVINNIDCIDCEKYREIPNYIDLNCTTILKDEKLKGKVKYGVIYNMVNDTLVIDKNQILFDNLTLKSQ